MMQSVNKVIQDYFIKMAPDFSVFDLVENHFYSKGLTTAQKEYVDYVVKISSTNTHTTKFFRAMFLVYTTGTVTLTGTGSDTIYVEKDKSYVVLPYRTGTQIVIAVQNTPITINSTTPITRIVEVAF
jgi:hypothetical protein